MTNYDKRECDYCGKEYMPARISQRFCCTVCYRKFNYEKRKNNKRKIQDEKICEICGKKYIPLKHNQKTCSVECREILQKQTQQKHSKKPKLKKHNFITIEEVIHFQVKHKQATGEQLSYTECCKQLGAL